MAGLIPKSFIHDLLDRADIVEVVDSRVALKKAGKTRPAAHSITKKRRRLLSVRISSFTIALVVVSTAMPSTF